MPAMSMMRHCADFHLFPFLFLFGIMLNVPAFFLSIGYHKIH